MKKLICVEIAIALVFLAGLFFPLRSLSEDKLFSFELMAICFCSFFATCLFVIAVGETLKIVPGISIPY